MNEVLEASLQGANIVPTILLMFAVAYWFIVMIGVIDLDFLDFDLDIDTDVDIDGPDVDTNFSVGWMNSILIFFNLGHVPFMLFLSFLALPMWIISIQANHMLGNDSLLFGIIYLIPNLLISLFIAKFLTMPFVKLFAKANGDGETTRSLVGKICNVILPLKSDSIGQIEVNIEGSNFRVMAKTMEGITMNKGEEGLIIEYMEEGQYYIVEPYQINI